GVVAAPFRSGEAAQAKWCQQRFPAAPEPETSYHRRVGLLLSDVPAIHEWLLRAAHVADGGPSFLRDLVARLRARGLPLWRVSLSLLTKHPEVLWRNLQWSEADGVKILERQHQTMQDPFFTLSPVARLV